MPTAGEARTVTLNAAGSSRVTIHLFGAHVTSWLDARGVEKIYTSPTALYDGSKAIRGGVPICWPQFAKNGPLKQHGFARNKEWELADVSPTTAVFTLRDSNETHALWPHKFLLRYTVRLADSGDELALELQVQNTGEAPFSFTTALHSYFTCDSASVKLTDYNGLSYLDTADGGTRKQQDGDIEFGKEVDRVYIDAPNSLKIAGHLVINKTNLPEAVVWNPFIEKATALSDMPNDGWEYFICIEPARVMEPASVSPGNSWTATVELSAVE